MATFQKHACIKNTNAQLLEYWKQENRSTCSQSINSEYLQVLQSKYFSVEIKNWNDNKGATSKDSDEIFLFKCFRYREGEKIPWDLVWKQFEALRGLSGWFSACKILQFKVLLKSLSLTSGFFQRPLHLPGNPHMWWPPTSPSATQS